ncbi:hypothetical protein KY334_06545 [Candidatus Woesearchaeota archaeon]|nr:hypothetical protein [Candidatus Woesearchaeota archaeon]
MDFDKLQKEMQEKIETTSLMALQMLQRDNIKVKATSWVGMNIFIVELENATDKPRALQLMEDMSEFLSEYELTILELKNNNKRFSIQF